MESTQSAPPARLRLHSRSPAEIRGEQHTKNSRPLGSCRQDRESFILDLRISILELELPNCVRAVLQVARCAQFHGFPAVFDLQTLTNSCSPNRPGPGSLIRLRQPRLSSSPW